MKTSARESALWLHTTSRVEKKSRKHVETVKWRRNNREPLKAVWICRLVQRSMKSRAVSDTTQSSRGQFESPSHTLQTLLFLRPHHSSLTLLFQLCCDTLRVVDTETRRMWLRSETVSNLRLDPEPAKAATSASLQRGPNSSDRPWQWLSASGFCENTLQTRVRNRAIYQKLKIAAHAESEWHVCSSGEKSKQTGRL